MHRLLLITLLFLYFFAPLLRISQISVNFLLLLFPISILGLVVSQHKRKYLLYHTVSKFSGITKQQNSKNIYVDFVENSIIFQLTKYILIPSSIVLIFLLMISGAYVNFADVSFIKITAYGFLCGPIMIQIYSFYLTRYQDQAWRIVLTDLGNVGIAHAILMLFALFNAELIQKLNVIFNLDQMLLLNSNGIDYRVYGISSYGGATLSVFYALIIIFESFVIPAKSITETLIKSLRIGVLALGILLSGRSGYVVILLFILSLPLLSIKGIIQINLRQSISIAIAIAIIFFSLDMALQTEVIQSVLLHTFEFYYRYQISGRISTNTTDVLLANHYFFPTDTSELLFGTGNFGRSSELVRLSADPGIVRAIWGSGILGLLILLIPNFSFALLGRKIKNKKIQFLLIGQIVLIAVLSFKEVFFFGTLGVTQCLWLLACIGCSSGLITQDSRKIQSRMSTLERRIYKAPA